MDGRRQLENARVRIDFLVPTRKCRSGSRFYYGSHLHVWELDKDVCVCVYRCVYIYIYLYMYTVVYLHVYIYTTVEEYSGSSFLQLRVPPVEGPYSPGRNSRSLGR